MMLEELYHKAYTEKIDAQGIYSMNEYCSSVKESATKEDIPSIMRLYYDKAVSAQNEFITIVLDKVVLESPKLSIKKVIENIEILKQEDALDCVFELLLIFIDWNEEITDVFIEELIDSPNENSIYFIERLKYEAYEKNDKSYAEFLSTYYKKLAAKNV